MRTEDLPALRCSPIHVAPLQRGHDGRQGACGSNGGRAGYRDDWVELGRISLNVAGRAGATHAPHAMGEKTPSQRMACVGSEPRATRREAWYRKEMPILSPRFFMRTVKALGRCTSHGGRKGDVLRLPWAHSMHPLLFSRAAAARFSEAAVCDGNERERPLSPRQMWACHSLAALWVSK